MQTKFKQHVAELKRALGTIELAAAPAESPQPPEQADGDEDFREDAIDL
jgi:hypothetical protein